MSLVFTSLINAYETLNKCYEDYKINIDSPLSEYICDSCIKRFEYTLEISWKLMKKIFVQNYGKSEQELTMNNIFRLMQGYGYTKDWRKWREYYEKRNNTAHEYNFEKARAILDIIPDFIKNVNYLIESIKEKEETDKENE